MSDFTTVSTVASTSVVVPAAPATRTFSHDGRSIGTSIGADTVCVVDDTDDVDDEGFALVLPAPTPAMTRLRAKFAHNPFMAITAPAEYARLMDDIAAGN